MLLVERDCLIGAESRKFIQCVMVAAGGHDAARSRTLRSLHRKFAG
jgi:hypothetical protein